MTHLQYDDSRVEISAEKYEGSDLTCSGGTWKRMVVRDRSYGSGASIVGSSATFEQGSEGSLDGEQSRSKNLICFRKDSMWRFLTMALQG